MDFPFGMTGRSEDEGSFAGAPEAGAESAEDGCEVREERGEERSTEGFSTS